MEYKTIKTETTEYIQTLTLNRPDNLNAFTVELANELIDAFEKANDDDSIRVIIVTGEGRAFCAGMDLSVAGNVFGLNARLQPTLEDMHAKINDPKFKTGVRDTGCLLYTSPSPRDLSTSRMPSSA